MSYTYDNIPNNVILKADSHCQNAEIELDDKTIKPFITEKQFWGDDETEGLYYDFTSKDNLNGYSKPHEGWDYYNENDSESMNSDSTAKWVKEHILEPNSKNLCIIQGYAGCGKTTFVYSILRKALACGSYSEYHDMYIGYNQKLDESAFITSSIQSNLVSKIIKVLKDNDGMEIYKTFIYLLSLDLSVLNPILYTEISTLFNREINASLFKYAQEIFENRNCKSNLYERKYRVQFNQAINAKISKLNSSCKYSSPKNKKYNVALDILICIDIIWHCAISLIRKGSSATNHIIVYDNLDIIDDHHVVADFIDTLREVLGNYVEFKIKMQYLEEDYCNLLPTFKAILTVRKITYASISRFVEVGSKERRQSSPDVDFLDVSALYPPSNVLKHKAKVFLYNFNSFIPKTSSKYENVKSYLENVSEMPDDLFTDVKLSDLLNQNIRACANMIDKVIETSSYQKYLKEIPYSDSQMRKSCRSAVWVNIISKILKELNILESLGYNSSSAKEIKHPTTVSRMILTLLSNYRQGFSKNVDGIMSYDVSFKEIVENFEKLPFCAFPKNSSWEKIVRPYLESSYNKKDSQKNVVQLISKMLQRNESVESLEIWRRPIYYTQNTFPILNVESTEKHLMKQIQNFSNPDFNPTKFCVTDEGYTFVEKIATHFEFSSVRFNGNKVTPLCCINDAEQIDKIIANVYEQIEVCTKKQIWLMNFYIKQNQETKDAYLKCYFHPRTTDHFKPQLHIVRMIYDHINYLNYCRQNLYENKALTTDLDNKFLKWIGKYLQLYYDKLFPELEGTVGEYFNKVWLDLKYLFWLNYFKSINSDFISINRKDNRYGRKANDGYTVSDENLKDIVLSEKYE